MRLHHTLIPVAAIAGALLAAGCGATERPGSAAVYDRIGAATNCATLQDEFDTAMANVDRHPTGDERRKASLGYAAAAQDRIERLGCP